MLFLIILPLERVQFIAVMRIAAGKVLYYCYFKSNYIVDFVFGSGESKIGDCDGMRE